MRLVLILRFYQNWIAFDRKRTKNCTKGFFSVEKIFYFFCLNPDWLVKHCGAVRFATERLMMHVKYDPLALIRQPRGVATLNV